MSLLDGNTDPPRSPSPSSGCESVEVTGVLAVTAFSATMVFDPEWSVSQVANDLHGHLSNSAQQLLELYSPPGLRGFDIFKCRFYTIYSPRLSQSAIHHICTAAGVQLPGGLQKPITDAKTEEDEEIKYLIMFDLPPDHANIVETYVKDNKENLAIAHGDRLVREEDELKAKKGKRGKKNKGGKYHNSVFPPTVFPAPESENMITSMIESDTSSQMYKVLKRLDEYDLKFAKQECANEELQRTNEDLQKTIAVLSTNVARVSYTHLLLRSRLNPSNHPS